MSLKHSYLAYVDESGDEGFSFWRGASEWFVLSAVVIRTANEPAAVRLLDRVCTKIGFPPGTPLHFRDLSHKQKLTYVEHIACAPLRTISIVAHKPSLDLSTLTLRPRLYLYATRMLIERVSWLCRDKAVKGTGQCSTRIIFSKRSGTVYAKIQDYLRYIKSPAYTSVDKVHWPSIDIDAIAAMWHNQRLGLQIADAVCGSMWAGLTKGHEAYALKLKPVVYSRNGSYRKYGFKVIPTTFNPEGEAKYSWMAAFSK